MVFVVATIVAGCAARTDLMDYRPEPGLDAKAPRPEMALVFFLRPTRDGVSSSVFDGMELIAVLMDQTYLSYETTPGKHRFMVLGEAADFMDAELEAGKVYFALVYPRFGVWRPRFSFKPLSPYDPEWKDVALWIAKSQKVTLNSAGRTWALENAASIREKHEAYLAKWIRKPEQQTLYVEYGVRFEDAPFYQ